MYQTWTPILIPMLLLIALLGTGSWAEDERLALWGMLLFFGPIFVYLAIRDITILFLRRNMRQRAPATAHLTDDLGDDTGLSPAAPLQFVEHDATTEIDLDPESQRRFRRAWWCGRWTLGAYLAALAIYLFLPFALIDHDRLDRAWLEGNGVFCLVAAAAFLASYWLHRRAGVVLGVATLIAALVRSALTAESLGAVAFLPPLGFGGALLLARWWIRRRMFIDGNYTLLILRVFDAARGTAFTFGAVLEKWRHIGSFLTIADPAYLLYRFSLFNRRNLLLALLGLLLYAGLGFAVHSVELQNLATATAWWQPHSDDERKFGLGLIALLLLILLPALPLYFLVRRSFSPSLAAVRKRLDAFKRRSVQEVREVFGGLAVYCFDNVWKPAVRDLIEEADVVLADLRGYSPGRNGCDYEIGQLFNRFHLDRAVFVVDETTSLADLYRCFRERWAKMSTRSPNRGSQKVQIYVVRRRNGRDARQLLRLLAGAARAPEAVSEAASAAVPVDAPQLQTA